MELWVNNNKKQNNNNLKKSNLKIRKQFETTTISLLSYYFL